MFCVYWCFIWRCYKNKTVTATLIYRRGSVCILYRILSGLLFLLPVILGHLPVLILAVHKRVLARKKVKRNFQFFELFLCPWKSKSKHRWLIIIDVWWYLMGYCGEEEPTASLALAALSSLSSWHHPQLLIFQQRGAEENRRSRNENTVRFFGWSMSLTVTGVNSVPLAKIISLFNQACLIWRNVKVTYFQHQFWIRINIFC